MNILMVTGIDGAQNCAAVVGKELAAEVEVASGRKAALAALRRQEFAAVVLDETMAECDPAAAEAIWSNTGLAIPLQVNFALSGAARLIRELRAGLRRRESSCWRAAPPPPPWRPSSSLRLPACCCTPNWHSTATCLAR